MGCGGGLRRRACRTLGVVGVEPKQPRAQRPNPRLVVPVAPSFEDPALLVDHAHRVFLARPIDPSEPPVTYHPHSLHPAVVDSSRREEPWRLLTDGALRARPPVAAHWAPRRNVRRRWSKTGPLTGQAQSGALPTSADQQSLTSKPEGALPRAVRCVGRASAREAWRSTAGHPEVSATPRSFRLIPRCPSASTSLVNVR